MRYVLTQELAVVFRQSQLRLDTCILHHENPICKIRQFTSRSRIVSLSQGINKTSLQHFTLLKFASASVLTIPATILSKIRKRWRSYVRSVILTPTPMRKRLPGCETALLEIYRRCGQRQYLHIQKRTILKIAG
jgi:hypothetical protein